MSTIPALHGPTLLVAFAATNLIMAAAILRRFARTARAGLRSWACGLAAQSAAAVLLLTPHGFEQPVLFLAATVLALGISAQTGAACALLHQRPPKWLLVATPALAVFAITGPVLALRSSVLLQPASAAILLGLDCLTTASSLAFLSAARNTDSIFRR